MNKLNLMLDELRSILAASKAISTAALEQSNSTLWQAQRILLDDLAGKAASMQNELEAYETFMREAA